MFDPPSAGEDAFRSGGGTPTAKMVSYAKRLAGNKNVPLPSRLERDFEICRRFLDQYLDNRAALSQGCFDITR